MKYVLLALLFMLGACGGQKARVDVVVDKGVCRAEARINDMYIGLDDSLEVMAEHECQQLGWTQCKRTNVYIQTEQGCQIEKTSVTVDCYEEETQ